jgi:hypothetical protein
MIKNVSLPTYGALLPEDGELADYCDVCELRDHHPDAFFCYSCGGILHIGLRPDLFVDGNRVQNASNGEYYTFTNDRIFMQTDANGHYDQSSLIAFVEFVRVHIDEYVCQAHVAQDVH